MERSELEDHLADGLGTSGWRSAKFCDLWVDDELVDIPEQQLPCEEIKGAYVESEEYSETKNVNGASKNIVFVLPKFVRLFH